MKFVNGFKYFFKSYTLFSGQLSALVTISLNVFTTLTHKHIYIYIYWIDHCYEVFSLSVWDRC